MRALGRAGADGAPDLARVERFYRSRGYYDAHARAGRVEQKGNHVRVTIADTGIGMDAATLSKATEPFFTTKGPGKGTGLGLSMVHGLAAQSGGLLRIDSAPNVGTTVDLWLPRAKACPASAVRNVERLKPPAAPKPCRVLVVDASKAFADKRSVLLTPTRPVIVRGTLGANAIVHAIVILRSHSMPEYWPADS